MRSERAKGEERVDQGGLLGAHWLLKVVVLLSKPMYAGNAARLNSAIGERHGKRGASFRGNQLGGYTIRNRPIDTMNPGAGLPLIGLAIPCPEDGFWQNKFPCMSERHTCI
jgi:hypothetical protein